MVAAAPPALLVIFVIGFGVQIADGIAHGERRGKEVCVLRQVVHALKVVCVATGRERAQSTKIVCDAFGDESD